MNETSRFLSACRREPVDRTPAWFMRQAGRYLPEYREIRGRHGFLTMCKTPDLAVEVTLQPLKRFDLDAAIIFSDLLLPLEAMGMTLHFAEGEGPVLGGSLETEADIDALRPPDPEEDLGYVLEALRLAREELKVPLIGFAGAPFTLASYAIEGRSSRHFIRTKRFMWEAPDLWNMLLSKIAAIIKDFLLAQIDAGAQAVQVFDSWVGCLGALDYERFVLPHTRSILEGISGQGVPVIHFGTGTAGFLDRIRAAGGDVIGVDWRIPLDQAWETIGGDRAIQGNLDPIALFAPLDALGRMVDDVLDRAAARPGHIFNLGHGILPETPIAAVEAVLERIRSRP